MDEILLEIELEGKAKARLWLVAGDNPDTAELLLNTDQPDAGEATVYLHELPANIAGMIHHATQRTDPRAKLAQARLEAAKLRTRAAHQNEQAQAARRQAAKPIYAGQAEICIGNAEKIEALAAENRARADLIEAEAEAAYQAATRQDAPPKTR
jgi:hypothetical protein